MELDEVEMRFYGSDSVDNLSQAFQRIALATSQLSPGQLCQRALTESAGFIASTLQSCRDLHGHTCSLTRESRTKGFLDCIQNLRLQAPAVQSLAWTTPPRQILGPGNQVNPRYSRESHDSGISSFSESDFEMSMPWKPGQCSELGKAAVLQARATVFSMGRNEHLTTHKLGMHILKASIYIDSHLGESGSSIDSLRPVTMVHQTSPTLCFCQGACSWCHTSAYEPLEAHVNRWHNGSSSRPNESGTEFNAYTYGDANDGDNSAACRYCGSFFDGQQEFWHQRAHDHISSDVGPETPSTQASPPTDLFSEAHGSLAKDDYNSAEEDTEVQYEQLVENIANMVTQSKWVRHIEDDCVPIIKYTHAYLENIQNYDDETDVTRKLLVSCTSPGADDDNIRPNMGGQGASGPANTNRKRKQHAGHGDHRKGGDDDEEDPKGNSPEDSDDPGWAGDKKRARVDDCQRFPCPYRKRHPTRFNVRKHPQCALNTFASMALLK